MNRIFLLGTAGAIALVVGAKMALNKQPDSALAVQSNSMLSVPSQSQPQTNPSPSPVIPPLAQSAPSYAQSYQSLQISTCGGRKSNANFRAYPSLSPSAILGGVESGQIVYLTGRSTYGDGVYWYEAIAPSLFPVSEPGAQNRTEPNQVGWIASCFVER